MKQLPAGPGRVESVPLGEFTLREVPIHVLDVNPVSSLHEGHAIRGVIGTRLLLHFLATIDYPAGALILQRSTPEASEALDQRLAVSDVAQIPFWLAETHMMLAWGPLNDAEPVHFFVDTGLAGKAFTALETDLKAGGITLDWSTSGLGGGGGGTVREVDVIVDRLGLGTGAHQVVRTNVPGSAIEGSTPPLGDVLGCRVGGLISHAFFRGSAVTFDFARMRMILEKVGTSRRRTARSQQAGPPASPGTGFAQTGGRPRILSPLPHRRCMLDRRSAWWIGWGRDAPQLALLPASLAR